MRGQLPKWERNLNRKLRRNVANKRNKTPKQKEQPPNQKNKILNWDARPRLKTTHPRFAPVRTGLIGKGQRGPQNRISIYNEERTIRLPRMPPQGVPLRSHLNRSSSTKPHGDWVQDAKHQLQQNRNVMRIHCQFHNAKINCTLKIVPPPHHKTQRAENLQDFAHFNIMRSVLSLAEICRPSFIILTLTT